MEKVLPRLEDGIESQQPQDALQGPKDPPFGAEFGGGLVVPASPRAKTSMRLKYEAESEVIRKKLGDLETIRGQLGLSQRKIAQLLLVDPSAWTRWTKSGEKAPPHVYRMLQWYLALQDKYPALDVNFWLNTVSQRPEITNNETKALLKEIAVLKARIAILESANESGAGLETRRAPAVASPRTSGSVGAMTSSTDLKTPTLAGVATGSPETNEKAARIVFFVMIAAALAALVFGFFA